LVLIAASTLFGPARAIDNQITKEEAARQLASEDWGPVSTDDLNLAIPIRVDGPSPQDAKEEALELPPEDAEEEALELLRSSGKIDLAKSQLDFVRALYHQGIVDGAAQTSCNANGCRFAAKLAPQWAALCKSGIDSVYKPGDDKPTCALGKSKFYKVVGMVAGKDENYVVFSTRQDPNEFATKLDEAQRLIWKMEGYDDWERLSSFTSTGDDDDRIARFKRKSDGWQFDAEVDRDDEGFEKAAQSAEAAQENAAKEAEARKRAATDEPLASPPLCGRVPSMYLTCSAPQRFCGGALGSNQAVTNYTPKHKGIAFEALDIESEACLVPASAYQLLDDIIDAVLAKAASLPKTQDHNSKIRYVLAVSRILGEVLVDKGFKLCNVDTLGDALETSGPANQSSTHYADCDTGSLILLTVAENLGLSAALVEILLPSGAGHNFVRWNIGDGSYVDWDTNGRTQCSAPNESVSFRGKAMTREQIKSYLLSMRANYGWSKTSAYRSYSEIHELELKDDRDAISLFPEHPTAYNNFVWTVATESFAHRAAYKDEALRYAEKLLTIDRRPTTLDTAACMYALTGDFGKAVTYASEAFVSANKSDSNRDDYRQHLINFTASPPSDCTRRY
jgi:hypothetical protein